MWLVPSALVLGALAPRGWRCPALVRGDVLSLPWERGAWSEGTYHCPRTWQPSGSALLAGSAPGSPSRSQLRFKPCAVAGAWLRSVDFCQDASALCGDPSCVFLVSPWCGCPTPVEHATPEASRGPSREADGGLDVAAMQGRWLRVGCPVQEPPLRPVLSWEGPAPPLKT